MKEKDLREVLGKCSKAELIEIIMKSSELTYATFPWMEIIAEIRLDQIEAEIKTILAEGKELTCKLKNIPKNQCNLADSETLQICIALNKNHKKWKQLNSKHDKICKEIYG